MTEPNSTPILYRFLTVVVACALLGACGDPSGDGVTASEIVDSTSANDSTNLLANDFDLTVSVDSIPDSLLGDSALKFVTDNHTIMEQASFPYELTKPDHKWKLGKKLREISGLTMLPNGNLACVQDEDGLIFQFDLTSGEIEDKSDFGKSGDYEGIAYTDKHVYVVRSNGDLYRVKELKKDAKQKKYETQLKTDHDVEGLCYQSSHNRLLLACKGWPGKGKKLKHKKAIYAFDLDEKELSKDPVYTIDLKAVEDSIKRSASETSYSNLSAFFDPGGGDQAFNPSAICEHPVTKELYLLSASSKLLIVLSAEGELLRVMPLNRDDFKQPEGLAFADDGTMYISNEGRSGHANILRFNYLH